VKRIILNVCFAVLALSSFAQETSNRRTERDAKKEERRQKIDNLIRQQEEGALIYNKQNVFGIRLNTDGLGLMFEKAYMKDVKTANYFSIELNEKRHPKEEKKSLQIPTGGGFAFFGTPYIYGKRNRFYGFSF